MAQKISQLISEARYIHKVDIFDAQVILSFLLKKPREFVVAHPEFLVSSLKRFKFFRLIKKRTKGIPLAYIIGHKEFFGLNFFVNKHTLVPRPDTEILTKAAFKECSASNPQIYIDIGTGSGCIPISIAKHRASKNIEFFATDISQKALQIAKLNAQKHNADITFLQGNLLHPILEKNISLQNKKIILTANLPYLTQKQFDEEKSIQREPISALVANDNGLALYKELLEQIFTAKISCTAFFEIDPSQTIPLSREIQKTFPTAKIQTLKDLSLNDRVIQWSM